MKVCLACGQRKPEGYIGVDIADIPGVDIVADLNETWPFEDGSVDEVLCEHYFEHVPKEKRPFFANELFRVLKPGGKATLVVPYPLSNRMYQDITHEWPPVVPEHFLYWNRHWRESQLLTHGPYAVWECDFYAECEIPCREDWETRSQEAIDFAVQHYHNVGVDLRVYLTRAD